MSSNAYHVNYLCYQPNPKYTPHRPNVKMISVLVYSALETGLYQKWADDIVEVASHIYDTDDEPIVSTESDNEFAIKVRIALGPFAVGI
ncbi:unnamed protein product, partial [Medioppia subpectinata]